MQAEAKDRSRRGREQPGLVFVPTTLQHRPALYMYVYVYVYVYMYVFMYMYVFDHSAASTSPVHMCMHARYARVCMHASARYPLACIHMHGSDRDAGQ